MTLPERRMRKQKSLVKRPESWNLGYRFGIEPKWSLRD